MFMANSILDELEFLHPHWVRAVDWSATQTESTRRRLLDQASIDGSLVLAYHIGSIGTVERSSGAYKLIQQDKVASPK
jgi:hypothetical protein